MTQKKLADLVPNSKNPRKITDEKQAMLTKSLDEFGDLGCIVFNEDSGQLVGGHQRNKSFNPDTDIIITRTYDPPTRTGTVKEGYFIVAEEKFNYRSVRWSPQKEKAAMISANRQGGEWDFPALSEMILELDHQNYDMDLIGYDMPEIETMMTYVKGHERELPGQGQPGCDEDEIQEVVQPNTKLGQIYQLGRHRLMCGDSTSKEDVERLMNGEKAEIAFSSPPYNVGRTPNGNDTKYLNDSDDKCQEDYCRFLCDYTDLALQHSEYVFVNIQSLAGNKLALIDYLYKMKTFYSDTIIWDKTSSAPALAKNVLNSRFEYIHVFSRRAKRVIGTKEFRGTLANIFQLSSRKDKEFSAIHKATFPVSFAEHFITNFSNRSVIDLFGGSGTSLIACEKTGHTCYMSEIDPHYCDVIIARWELFSGQKAQLL